MKLKLELFDKDKNVKLGKNDYEDFQRQLVAEGEDYVQIATQEMRFSEGDTIKLTVQHPNQFLVVKLDETLDPTLIYLTGKEWVYRVPLSSGDLPSASDLSFKGKSHYLSARLAKDHEIKAYKNLALNPHDQKEISGAYPHATANVETRNDSTFFAKNAINGIYANLSHGSYPYQSWGINRQTDAAITIDFGRLVTVDKIGLVLRSDFPHDSYWEQVSVIFSDGSEEILSTVKSPSVQMFDIIPRTTTNVTLTNLIKAADDSPFPALTELEVYGTESL